MARYSTAFGKFQQPRRHKRGRGSASPSQAPPHADRRRRTLCFPYPMRPSCPLLLALQLQPVSDHGDELRIGWLALGGIHRVSKVLLQGFQVAPIPCYLNGVANGPLHPAGSGGKAPCHLRVQYLGDGVDDVHVVHRQQNGLPQILIAFDMGRYADLMNDGRYHPL